VLAAAGRPSGTSGWVGVSGWCVGLRFGLAFVQRFGGRFGRAVRLAVREAVRAGWRFGLAVRAGGSGWRSGWRFVQAQLADKSRLIAGLIVASMVYDMRLGRMVRMSGSREVCGSRTWRNAPGQP